MDVQLQELTNEVRTASLKEYESIEKKISRMEQEAELKSLANEGNKFD